MGAKELRELSTEELRQKQLDLEEGLFRLKMRAAVSQLENPTGIRQHRRDIARIATLLRERTLEGGPSSSPEQET
ncbi:MAG: 50S ribosomal protein L29 [Candidatus Methylomirabilales bacterium]